jgi:hypothetical protein
MECVHVSTQDEQKEATSHVDLHDTPGGPHPPLIGGRRGVCSY